MRFIEHLGRIKNWIILWIILGTMACSQTVGVRYPPTDVPVATPSPSMMSFPSPVATPATVPQATTRLTPTIRPTISPEFTATPGSQALPSFTMEVHTSPRILHPLAIPPAEIVLAKNLPEPDDLLVGADGSIYVSDVKDGSIRRLKPDGSLAVVLSGIQEPEGMVFLSDGSMLIVEQGKNRVLQANLTTQKLLPFLELTNISGGLGVDGIALDASQSHTPTLIIPDSPNNRLLRVNLEDKTQSVIASGLIRPTGAWVEPDGNLLVVEENGGWLDRVQPDGQIHHLAQLPTPDDVVEDPAGNIFVTTLGDGAIHWVDGKSGQDRIVVKGLSSPQGLAMDLEGNLLVTDPGHHQVLQLSIRP